MEALDDLIGGCDRPDFDEFNTWSEAQPLHLYVVGALTGLTPLAGEAIAGQPVHRGRWRTKTPRPCSLRIRPSFFKTSTAWRAVMRITSYISAKPGLAR